MISAITPGLNFHERAQTASIDPSRSSACPSFPTSDQEYAGSRRGSSDAVRSVSNIHRRLLLGLQIH